MTQVFHCSKVGPLNLVRSRLGHLRCGRPVVLSSEEVDRALLDIDFGDSVSRIETTKVEVEVLEYQSDPAVLITVI